jgi:hypothetical protein
MGVRDLRTYVAEFEARLSHPRVSAAAPPLVAPSITSPPRQATTGGVDEQSPHTRSRSMPGWQLYLFALAASTE